MEQDFKKPLFSKAILSSLFVGIFATLLCIFFNVVFVETTNFPLHDFINVSTLIFGVNTIFLVIGFLYYGFIQIKKGELLFIIFFVLLTALLIWRGENAHRVNDQKLNTEFREQLAGIILIIGLAASFVLPLLFHSKKFEDEVI
jgi:hypothetical protein